jgi:hypothetical protein
MLWEKRDLLDVRKVWRKPQTSRRGSSLRTGTSEKPLSAGETDGRDRRRRRPMARRRGPRPKRAWGGCGRSRKFEQPTGSTGNGALVYVKISKPNSSTQHPDA